MFLLLYKDRRIRDAFTVRDFRWQRQLNRAPLCGDYIYHLPIQPVAGLRKANPIELLRGGSIGEKEPKTKILLTLFGIASIATGYVLANIVETRSRPSASSLYVLLVIVERCALPGRQYRLFKDAEKERSRFIIKPSIFTLSVSGMIYRMKQNAVGLANICILHHGSGNACSSLGQFEYGYGKYYVKSIPQS